jgi:hypothetical protein
MPENKVSLLHRLLRSKDRKQQIKYNTTLHYGEHLFVSPLPDFSSVEERLILYMSTTKQLVNTHNAAPIPVTIPVDKDFDPADALVACEDACAIELELAGVLTSMILMPEVAVVTLVEVAIIL